MENFLNQYGYIALLIGTFFEGETAILIASSLVHAGIFEIPGTVFFAFAGSFISDWVYYLIGRLNGKYFIDKRPKLQARVEPVKRFFHKHKLQLLFSYRFLYGFRIIIPLIIGMSNIRPLQYLGYSVATGLLWASIVSAAGYWIGLFFKVSPAMFEENILFVVGGFALVGVLLGYAVKRFAMKEMNVSPK